MIALWNSKVSDICLTASEQFISHFMSRTSYTYCVFRGEATYTNGIVLGLIRSRVEPAIYHNRGEQLHHQGRSAYIAFMNTPQYKMYGMPWINSIVHDENRFTTGVTFIFNVCLFVVVYFFIIINNVSIIKKIRLIFLRHMESYLILVYPTCKYLRIDCNFCSVHEEINSITL